jgi:mannose-6-phosphate isomerase
LKDFRSVNTPVRFEPFVRPMVWGGRRLGEVLGKPLATREPYGESWDLSDHSLHHSQTVGGRSLRQLMEEKREGLLGNRASAYSQFPWLVKFLDAEDWLSVQVHPDEYAVRELWPGEGSKTEAWFILDAKPGSRIYAGLRPGVDERKLRAALDVASVTECLHSFEPRAGDCVYLKAGTVHAVGGGVLMAEVQQTSDATFRLFDWNRKDAQGKSRTLHIREALACIDWTRGPVEPVHAAGFATPADKVSKHERQHLIRCDYFELDYLQSREPMALGGEGRMQVFIALRGSGRLGAEEIHAGQVWLLPASMPATPCTPHGVLGGLLSTLP